MCRKPALAATVLTPLLAFAALAGAPAWADQPVKAPAAAASPSPKAAPPAKAASPAERAAADRMEPLARATFWAGELSKNPADGEAGVKLATAMRQLGRNQEAYNTVQQVLALKPDDADALLESARDAISGNQGFFAIAPAQAFERLRPKDWRGPSLLGVAYEQTRQPELALAAHQRALALAPDNPAALCNLGMFYASQGDTAQAEALLRKAAALPGATVQVRQDLALILGLKGDLVESERLQRQDLPPDLADANMAYLKAATSPVPFVSPLPGRAPAQAEPKDRSWNAVAKAEAQAQD
jgi:Flp pilus assembly protein TadD